MAKIIMVQGTTSNAGKTLTVAGLCRIFAQDGYKVAPFKAQNIALNSYITKNGLEMGRAQVVQAEACFKEPSVDMNPILLKPTGDRTTQVILNGKSIGNLSMYDYKTVKKDFVKSIKKAFDKLCSENDIVVIEGAGSPSEININKDDIVNMGMAKLAQAPVILVGDIDKGGVFASLYGTYMLLDNESKKHIKGTVINKFRGDVEILKSGIDKLKELICVDDLGVVPYIDVKIDDEDGVSDVFYKNVNEDIDIVVIHLPKISNYTDFSVFKNLFNIDVRYVKNVGELKTPDLIIIPGSKNTIDDLKWLKQSGLAAKIMYFHSKNTPIFGVCGGYQMLTQKISDPFCVESGGEVEGLGLLNGETIFNKEKITTQVTGIVKKSSGIFADLVGVKIKGYEIHMGTTNGNGKFNEILCNGENKSDGSTNGNVYGTYVHGIFDEREFTERILKSLYAKKGLEYNVEKSDVSIDEFKETQYNKLASVFRETLNIEKIYEILDKGM